MEQRLRETKPTKTRLAASTVSTGTSWHSDKLSLALRLLLLRQSKQHVPSNSTLTGLPQCMRCFRLRTNSSTLYNPLVKRSRNLGRPWNTKRQSSAIEYGWPTTNKRVVNHPMHYGPGLVSPCRLSPLRTHMSNRKVALTRQDAHSCHGQVEATAWPPPPAK